MTVEDPVEYELPGLTQIQVEPKRDVTFASALRSILRQDPDVVFVGEIRDLETAEVAIQASLTGHLVLATLHANDAVGAIARFTDIGVDRAKVATTLRGAVAQRLARRVCSHCTQGETTLQEVERVLGEMGGTEAEATPAAPHILLVDDDPVGRALAKSVLEKNGFRISEASDGAAALERLDGSPDFALMVLDLEM